MACGKSLQCDVSRAIQQPEADSFPQTRKNGARRVGDCAVLRAPPVSAESAGVRTTSSTDGSSRKSSDLATALHLDLAIIACRAGP